MCVCVCVCVCVPLCGICVIFNNRTCDGLREAPPTDCCPYSTVCNAPNKQPYPEPTFTAPERHSSKTGGGGKVSPRAVRKRVVRVSETILVLRSSRASKVGPGGGWCHVVLTPCVSLRGLIPATGRTARQCPGSDHRQAYCDRWDNVSLTFRAKYELSCSCRA